MTDFSIHTNWKYLPPYDKHPKQSSRGFFGSDRITRMPLLQLCCDCQISTDYILVSWKSPCANPTKLGSKMARILQGCSGWQKYYVSKYQKKKSFFCSNSVNQRRFLQQPSCLTMKRTRENLHIVILWIRSVLGLRIATFSLKQRNVVTKGRLSKTSGASQA